MKRYKSKRFFKTLILESRRPQKIEKFLLERSNLTKTISESYDYSL
jgi:hypothetical protein